MTQLNNSLVFGFERLLSVKFACLLIAKLTRYAYKKSILFLL